MGLKWVGNKHGLAGVPGIPARDLSAEEVERYGGEAHLRSLSGGRLYVPDAEALRASRDAPSEIPKMERPFYDDKMRRRGAADHEDKER